MKYVYSIAFVKKVQYLDSNFVVDFFAIRLNLDEQSPCRRIKI